MNKLIQNIKKYDLPNRFNRFRRLKGSKNRGYHMILQMNNYIEKSNDL